jgi:hypothetical protein
MSSCFLETGHELLLFESDSATENGYLNAKTNKEISHDRFSDTNIDVADFLINKNQKPISLAVPHTSFNDFNLLSSKIGFLDKKKKESFLIDSDALDTSHQNKKARCRKRELKFASKCKHTDKRSYC